MSLQIKQIVIYNHEGKTRELTFRIGQPNIITGKSSTGKSSLIEIVEYCFGRSTFRIPEGVIRDSVSWYGVLYKLDETFLFIAKPAPKDGHATQSQVYFEAGSDVSAPAYDKLVTNSNDNAITEYFSSLIGISANLNIPSEGQSRDPLEATIAHTRFYLFQKQSVIANQDILFHRQQEEFMPLAIKDTLPYFLGTIQEERLKLLHELRIAKRDLKLAERALADAQSISSDTSLRGRSLLAEGQQAEIISSSVNPSGETELLRVLRETASWRPTYRETIEPDRITNLTQQLYDLRSEFQETQNKIEAAETFAHEEQAYSGEAAEQELRLQSIRLVDDSLDSSDKCPLCNSTMLNSIPKAIEIKKSLSALRNNLEMVHRERPRLRQYISNLIEGREKIRQQIREAEFTLESVKGEIEASQQLRDRNARAARVIGRISLFLESQKASDTAMNLQSDVDRALERVKYYEDILDPSVLEDGETSILSIIGMDMTAWARELRLEHMGYPHRFDIGKLTVVADRPNRPIAMANMGGAENFLGCHLITLFALHSYFVKQKRPVPGFLFLDQPSQVYFPSERYKALEGKPSELTDTDRIAVRRLYDFIFKIVGELNLGFQVIITEHANIDTPEYQDALVEEPWVDGRALVPLDWIKQ